MAILVITEVTFNKPLKYSRVEIGTRYYIQSIRHGLFGVTRIGKVYINRVNTLPIRY